MRFKLLTTFLIVLVLVPLAYIVLIRNHSKGPYPLYVQEIDNFTVQLSSSGAQTVFYSQKLGVGLNAKEGKNLTADVTLRDAIASGDSLFYPQQNPFEIRTLYGKPYSIFWSENNNQLSFDLKSVPTVVLEHAGSCCGCDNECGGGCSVEFFYQSTSRVSPSKWADVSIKADCPNGLRLKQKGLLHIDLSINNKGLDTADVRIVVPKILEDLELGLDEMPVGFEKVDNDRWLLLSKKIGKGLEKISLDLTLSANRTGRFRLPKIVQITGSFDGLVYPRAQVKTERAIKRTEKTYVTYQGSIYAEVK
jgi:hypothetical protein